VRKAVSSFDTITYKRQTKVQPGKSRRLADQEVKKKSAATISPETVRHADEPVFDIKKALKVAPGLNWNELTPTYNLDSHKMRRYVVEDVMYADPEKRERLLLLVSEHHIAIDTTWLPIYRAQNASRVPIMFEKNMFFQIEAEVVKNAKRDDYIKGLVTEDELTYHLSYEGGSGVCLHFPNCHTNLDIELKFASIIFEVTAFQVWGTRKLGRDFFKRLVKLKNDANREALFSRYLIELYGDTTQTMYLSANYKVFENDPNPAPEETTTAASISSGDPYPDLVFCGDYYKTFEQHVEGVFRDAVMECYGCFVSLTVPIVSQLTIVRLVDLFKSRFKTQYWVLATMLNYNEHMKLAKNEHLLPFYDRMIFYHFMSICRVRSHKTFSWWALINACIRYGSSNNSATSGLDSVFFGHSIVPYSLMRKTKEFREINETFFKRIYDSLRHDPILLAVFDNTQIGIQQKFQRDGKSSLFLKLTAKMFVKLQHNWSSHDLKTDAFNFIVPITFLNQVIVSPFGMPCYETLLHKPAEFAIAHYDDVCFDPSLTSDSTGLRVASYVDHVFLAGEFESQQRFLSRPNQAFKFYNARSGAMLKESQLVEIISKNRSNDGLYERAFRFQRESVRKWKGDQSIAKLLCLPLSLDDETKTEECGAKPYYWA
jgi:hypothetical protein